MDWREEYRQLRLRQQKAMCEKMVEVWNTELAEYDAEPSWIPYPEIIKLENRVFSNLQHIKFKKSTLVTNSNQHQHQQEVRVVKSPEHPSRDEPASDDDFACLLPIED